MIVAVPVVEREVNGKKLVNPHFGKAGQFAIVDTESGKTEFIENPALNVEKGKGRAIAETFIKKGVSAVLVKEIGPGAFEKLSSSGISVFLVPAEVKFLNDAVELLKKEELPALKEPNEV